ncbi:MAG: DUF4148 domain-containing protein [Rhizobacter sp.]|nr:DUF4148 domain-containing protein [Rhizobacter sp.]
MNTKQVIAAAAIAFLGSSAAFAQSEIDLQYFGADQASSVSRADVRADVRSALAAGELTTPSEVSVAAVPASSATAVAQLRNRLTVAEMTTPAEVTASAVPAQASSLSREAVRAEARAFARSDVYKANARIGAGY